MLLCKAGCTIILFNSKQGTNEVTNAAVQVRLVQWGEGGCGMLLCAVLCIHYWVCNLRQPTIALPIRCAYQLKGGAGMFSSFHSAVEGLLLYLAAAALSLLTSALADLDGDTFAFPVLMQQQHTAAATPTTSMTAATTAATRRRTVLANPSSLAVLVVYILVLYVATIPWTAVGAAVVGADVGTVVVGSDVAVAQAGIVNAASAKRSTLQQLNEWWAGGEWRHSPDSRRNHAHASTNQIIISSQSEPERAMTCYSCSRLGQLVSFDWRFTSSENIWLTQALFLGDAAQRSCIQGTQ